ncbi:MAG: threonylcarbamoyl-AMP synthase [Methanosphaera sp. rholeuAM6]|nr:MAG: threonylcarbamoyl-AMP synthase [Methanosphaera sp. rholeuAM6]
MTVLNYNDGDNLKNIVDILREGKLVVYPTDTIYGIAADINNVQAIRNVFHAKKRSFDKAISVCFHDIQQLENYVSINDKIKEILEKSLPGPYTFLLNKNTKINPLLTAKTSIVGVRIPDNVISYELTREFPVTSTSANISDFPTSDNITEIQKQLGGNIDVYMDVGILKNNIPSTIIDLTGDKAILVRKGMADEKLLDEILKINL